jgi:2-C-methyl-D-erythritol 4-phosphate cytidylyltransferase
VISAIIVAAGKSTRMGRETDKLFLTVAGRPLVAQTWGRFDGAPFIDEIILVVREGRQREFAELAVKYAFAKPFRLVAGGKERQDSVWQGLQHLAAGAEIVAIQDAARPCTSLAMIQATIKAARQDGAAVAAQPVIDTIKLSQDGEFISRHLDRSLLWAVQTPQTFRVEVIRRALAKVRETGLQVTDDTAACELIGQPVRLVLDTEPNPKVTIPDDVPYVEMLLNSSNQPGPFAPDPIDSQQ